MADKIKLNPEQEKAFWLWLKGNYEQGKITQGDYEHYLNKGYGFDYDFRNAFQTGATPEINQDDGLWHWPDTGKKLNHPSVSTYSNDSIYLPKGENNMSMAPPQPNQLDMIRDKLSGAFGSGQGMDSSAFLKMMMIQNAIQNAGQQGQDGNIGKALASLGPMLMMMGGKSTVDGQTGLPNIMQQQQNPATQDAMGSINAPMDLGQDPRTALMNKFGGGKQLGGMF